MRYALYLAAAFLLLFAFWGCQNTDGLVDPSSDSSINPGNSDGETDVIIPGRWYWICGTVFNDVNGNQVQDDDEAGIPDVTVNLQDNGSTTTDENGDYCFRVRAGSYTVEVVLSDEYPIVTTPNPLDVSVPFASVYDVDFGLITRQQQGLLDGYNICGTVLHWERLGFLNWQLLPEDGVSVKLYTNEDLDWDPIAETVTDDEGHFCFNGLESGHYWLYSLKGFEWSIDHVYINDDDEENKIVIISIIG